MLSARGSYPVTMFCKQHPSLQPLPVDLSTLECLGPFHIGKTSLKKIKTAIPGSLYKA